ncbi:prepilin-type N-terminal cleavage/methylation domain-containing protein [Kineococcus sp. R8]|uniref:prepilin-type N-terminal cleavage/methylation domain-containing protein n=1 Tax=Kineococcus siccus TaxID=2696567 RepID=UPI001412FE24|nr:prepilin-type N-terminal cleavage/methylation domain-containing protein [Kineococcus siccus]
MLARFRKSMDEKDQGFTLIELLVVMIIIGILAAIAIPVFLNQRKSAVDSALKSDLNTVAQAMELYAVDNQAYPSTVAVSGTTVTLSGAAGSPSQTTNISTGNTVSLGTATVTGSYCVIATRVADQSPGTQTAWVFNSAKGGLQAKGTTSCGPATATP